MELLVGDDAGFYDDAMGSQNAFAEQFGKEQ